LVGDESAPVDDAVDSLGAVGDAVDSLVGWSAVNDERLLQRFPEGFFVAIKL
jgi:hypothetical protein